MNIVNINKINEIPSDLLDNYKNKISEGKEIWINKKVIICGLARNCINKIDKNIELINRLGNFFKEYKIIVFENNSNDGTKEYLKNNNIINIGFDDDETFIGGVEKTRVKRLVKYRSKLQEYIKEKYNDYDYVIIIDLDISLWSIDGILTSLAWEKDFDVMGSFSQKYSTHPSHDGWLHYDRWAFKFHSWHEEISKVTDSSLNWFTLWKPPIGASPIKCLSVFGGLAIYKMKAYLSGTYGHKHPEEVGKFDVVCEHSQFHYTLHKNGYNKIFLNPSQRCIILE